MASQNSRFPLRRYLDQIIFSSLKILTGKEVDDVPPFDKVDQLCEMWIVDVRIKIFLALNNVPIGEMCISTV